MSKKKIRATLHDLLTKESLVFRAMLLQIVFMYSLVDYHLTIHVYVKIQINTHTVNKTVAMSEAPNNLSVFCPSF